MNNINMYTKIHAFIIIIIRARVTINELHEISTAISKKQVYKDAEVLTFPKFLLNLTLGRVMVWMNNRGWKTMAKKKGVDVDAKPYARAAIG